MGYRAADVWINIEVRQFDGTVRVEELTLVMYNNIGTMKSRIRTGTLLFMFARKWRADVRNLTDDNGIMGG